jgi:predicted DNA-binding ribbon-helix-helix protein
MRKRSITLKGHRTSISLEDEFWTALDEIATADGLTVPRIVSRVDRERLKLEPPPGLSSALRVYILKRKSAD